MKDVITPARALFLSLVLLFSWHGEATTVRSPRDFAELAAGSDAVVLAKAGESSSAARGRLVSTSTAFIAVATVKGGFAAGDPFDVEVAGGATGQMTWQVVGAPRFDAGTTYLLFLQARPDGRYSPSAMAYGVLRETRNSRKERLLVTARELRDLDPSAVAAYRLEPLLANLEAARVQSPAQVIADDVMVNGCMMIMGPTGNPTRFRTFDAGGTVDIHATEGGDNGRSGGGLGELQSAISQWMGISGTGLELRWNGTIPYGTPCSGYYDAPAQGSIIVFNDPCGFVPNDSWTLAVGAPVSHGGTHTFDNRTWDTATAFAVAVHDVNANGLSYDNYSVMLAHEIGHGLGFHHSSDPGALMYFQCCRHINDSDRGCARYVYPEGGCASDKYGDGPSDADPVRRNDTFPPECINGSNDEDWFQFFGERGDRVSVTVTPSPGVSLIPQVAIRRVGCTSASCPADISVSAPSPGAQAAIQSFALTDTGRFYVKIRGSGTSSGEYAASFNVTRDVPDEDDVSHDLGSSERHFVDYPGDVDWYRFNVDAGDEVTFDVENRNGSTYSESGSFKLQAAIYASKFEGSIVSDPNNDNTSVPDARIRYTFSSGGTYYLKVRGWDAHVGYYRLTSTRIAGCRTISEAPSLWLSASPTSMSVSWNAVQGAGRYLVYRNGLLIYDGGGTSTTDWGLQPNTTYCYTIVAANACSTGPQSGAWCATTPCEPVQAHTSAPAVTPLDSTSIHVAWNAVPHATWYRLMRYSTVVYEGPDMSFVDTGLSAGSQYCYSVVASNACSSFESNGQCAQTACPSLGTATPHASVAGPSSVRVAWGGTPNAAGYRLYRNGALIYDGTATEIIDGAVQPSTTYCYSVAPYSTCGSGPRSGEFCVSVPSPLAAPAFVTASALSPSSVIVAWPAATSAAYYYVSRYSRASYSDVLFATSATSFTDSNVAAGTTYQYWIRSVDQFGNVSPYSPSDIATTVTFTDPSLEAGETVVKAQHMVELRAAVNSVRHCAGLAPYPFTGTIGQGTTVLALHLHELRAAIDEARWHLGIPPFGYGEAIAPGTTRIGAAHVVEIRIATR
jgi:hypothetical protein